MISRPQLLAELQRLLRALEADLLQRSASADVPEIGRALRADFDQAREAGRTAQSFEEWRGDYITQTAAAWVLSCVFARFLEDNRLIDPPKLAGENERLERARDERTLYFRSHPTHTDRDYLLAVFDGLASLPGGKEIFGAHNPLHEMTVWLSGDAAGELLAFFQRIDADTGRLVHEFTDPEWDTRFLGDLYQDLSEAARKRYALLQTPVFVEEFILDRTLEPALDEFGLDGFDGFGFSVFGFGDSQSDPKTQNPNPKTQIQKPKTQNPKPSFRMIDPACGSGHFLLGAFPRLLERWQKQEPGTKVRELVQRVLDAIHGVDVNPYAVAIARFRLLLMAMRSSGITRLADAPAFTINVVCGDSLLHGVGQQQSLGYSDVDHATYAEDLPELRRILVPGRYHAVVANPPYITPKDRALNQAYRDRYGTCHMKYSLAVPFMERIFRLAVEGGFTGQITANSFMKREFGKKLIEQFLPTVDLTHVIDTSLAYIPGHGTPTVILLGRHRKPLARTIRVAGAIKREDEEPKDPARGLVWSAIENQVDLPGSRSEFVSVADTPRDSFGKHPWSIGGGGAAELKEHLENTADSRLSDAAESIGFMAITGEDDAFVADGAYWLRRTSPSRPFGVGDVVRDWSVANENEIAFMYRLESPVVQLLPVNECGSLGRAFWPYSTILRNRLMFGRRPEESGVAWYEYRYKSNERLLTPLSIVFAFVATHNHFVLDRGGKVFKQSAPVIKLEPDATEDAHLALLGLLNSSVAAAWLRQVCHDKGGGGIGGGIAAESWERFIEYTGTKLLEFPVPADRPLLHATFLNRLAEAQQVLLPSSVLRSGIPTRKAWGEARRMYHRVSQEMIAAQEELDWACYRLYGLLDDELVYHAARTPAVHGPHPPCADGESDGELTPPKANAPQDPIQLAWMVNEISAPPNGPPSASPSAQGGWGRGVAASASLADPLIHHPDKLDGVATQSPKSEIQNPTVALGQRAFEIVMARKMAAGELQTTWFERHGSTPITELPDHWPEGYRRLVERRIDAIKSNPQIALIEQPEYKRRWNAVPWDEQAQQALREWLLNRLEGYFDFDGRMERDGHSGEWESQNAKCKMQNVKRAAIGEGGVVSVARVADLAQQDADFMQVAELYCDDPAFDVPALVAELVEAESVPLLPSLRYKPSGLRKRAEWETTWQLQRQEDAIGARTKLADGDPERLSEEEARDLKRRQIGDIPVPPKYASADFLKNDYWRLRGKLDVPKERWVSFPHCEGPDGTLVVAWAGYDHLQLARAISGYYVEVQERLGGRDDPRLMPLLACLIELLPWLKQWHNAVDPEFGLPMGDYFEGFVQEEARQMGKTLDEIKAWQPPAQRSRRRMRSRA